MVEKDEFLKEQKKVIERVRARQSYTKFSEFIDFMKEHNPTELELLKRIHSLIDSVRGFGSLTNSHYALESIEQLAKDRGWFE